MMAADVSVYDGKTVSLSLITSTSVDVIATRRSNGSRLAYSPTTHGSAHLRFPGGAYAVVVTVVDPHGHYGSTLVSDLNGNTSITLELVLYPLPPPTGGGGSGGPSTRGDIPDYIDQQSWSEPSKKAVRSLARTYETIVDEKLDVGSAATKALKQALEAVGIEPAVIEQVQATIGAPY